MTLLPEIQLAILAFQFPVAHMFLSWPTTGPRVNTVCEAGTLSTREGGGFGSGGSCAKFAQDAGLQGELSGRLCIVSMRLKQVEVTQIPPFNFQWDCLQESAAARDDVQPNRVP
jgi:hypothetical protein